MNPSAWIKYAGIAISAALAVLVVISFILLNLNGPAGNLFTSTPANQLQLYGRLAGIIMGLIFLFQLLTMGSGRTLQKFYSKAVLMKMHRILGFSVLLFLVAHIVLLFAGKSMAYDEPGIQIAWSFLSDKRWGTMAGVGVLLLCAVLFFTLLWKLKKMKFPAWKKTHYWAYAVIFLLFFHQIFDGFDFANSLNFKLYWIALFVLAFADGAIWHIRLWRDAK